MNKLFSVRSLLRVFLLILITATATYAQKAVDVQTELLLGRWEVLNYAEQGVPVDKKQPALPQAITVYRHIRSERAKAFYNYYDAEDNSRREERSYERWAERDSIREVARLQEMIARPTFAVFFADSTLAVYNKSTATNLVADPLSLKFAFSPATNSLDIIFGDAAFQRWQGQVLLLTATRMTLFIPDEGEIVELVKTPFSLP